MVPGRLQEIESKGSILQEEEGSGGRSRLLLHKNYMKDKAVGQHIMTNKHIMEHVENTVMVALFSNTLFSFQPHLGNINAIEVSLALLWNFELFFLALLGFPKVGFVCLFLFFFFFNYNMVLTGHFMHFPVTYFERVQQPQEKKITSSRRCQK